MSLIMGSYYWDNRDRIKERNRDRYHEMKERYKEKYEERRERCIAYMKDYNKPYYQAHREEILEKAKAYGQDMRDLAMQRERKKRTPKKTKGRVIDGDTFTIEFDT